MLEQTLSVVIPVFRAGPALATTLAELTTLDALVVGPSASLKLIEVILVCDNPELSRTARAELADLANSDPRIQIVWLATNFGQHPATVAGIVSSNGDWVATMDEDGQHDPSALVPMVIRAAVEGRPLVYAKPSNPPPHGWLRNLASRLTKSLFVLLTGSNNQFHSFRMVEGEVARSACSFVGENVYLDVALIWSCGTATTEPVAMRAEEAPSSYSIRRLVSHFWRMVVSAGTRPLRLVAGFGLLIALAGLVVATIVGFQRVTNAFDVPGWTSVMVALLILTGGLYLSLAVLAEYVGFAVRNTVGKPVYVKASPPNTRALWRLQLALAEK